MSNFFVVLKTSEVFALYGNSSEKWKKMCLEAGGLVLWTNGLTVEKAPILAHCHPHPTAITAVVLPYEKISYINVP